MNSSSGSFKNLHFTEHKHTRVQRVGVFNIGTDRVLVLEKKRLGSGTDRAFSSYHPFFGGHSDLSVAMGFAPPSCERLDRRHCADRVLTNISGSDQVLRTRWTLLGNFLFVGHLPFKHSSEIY